MDSLKDLLGQKDSGEPEEIAIIKHYIDEQFQAESNVKLHGKALIITVSSASLANALRLRLPTIQAAAKTNKKLIFRIG